MTRSTYCDGAFTDDSSIAPNSLDTRLTSNGHPGRKPNFVLADVLRFLHGDGRATLRSAPRNTTPAVLHPTCHLVPSTVYRCAKQPVPSNPVYGVFLLDKKNMTMTPEPLAVLPYSEAVQAYFEDGARGVQQADLQGIVAVLSKGLGKSVPVPSTSTLAYLPQYGTERAGEHLFNDKDAVRVDPAKFAPFLAYACPTV